MQLRIILSGLALAAGALSSASVSGAPKRPFVPTTAYETRSVEGWTVRVNRSLLGDRKELGDRALRLLETKLYEIGRVVPAKACGELRKVPIWLGLEDGHAPCAEYHPSAEWLRENGYNPDKARAVEIGSAERFLSWSKSQPAMVLHELAHAYHHQVFGYEHAGVRQAFRDAAADKRYEAVLHINGRTERAYALSNPQEYFAEATEAYFSTNDFYPFVRPELAQHDPGAVRLLKQVWGD